MSQESSYEPSYESVSGFSPEIRVSVRVTVFFFLPHDSVADPGDLGREKPVTRII